MSGALTTSERRDLETYEEVVRHGIDTFVEVGRALAEIRDRHLYRADFATFEDYCRERWELGRTRAYQLISASKVNGAMSTIVDVSPPVNEAQARELAPLRDDEQAMVEVWRDLRERHGDRLTAHLVKTEVEQHLARKPKVDCPGCGRTVLADRIDAPRRHRPGTCPRCGNKMPMEIASYTAYSIDSERSRVLAEKAVERFWKLVTARGGNPVDEEPVHELIHLDRALALLSDEDVAEAITSLEKGIAETKAMVEELRRHQRRNGSCSS